MILPQYVKLSKRESMQKCGTFVHQCVFPVENVYL